ncbi:ABC transporter substrate-binding protein [Roseovarius sp. EGI FJ00037]|uniref:ABC transporter substrate-binding protein n=1 Tax=Roseovarius salincola TaxID=2978479 RepID=UPI0022A80952|nr:ABC transporter substrate-binding protein [Roseovarius sp. EGI FJ00037]MCZ0811675.1 ABC transporter substrate-binding protein [Roseovarius sp. EGI FJ00037]
MASHRASDPRRGSGRRGAAARLAPAALAALAALAPAARADPPGRVVSMNLCTDQLAMLIADEGQLHSVSHVALDPRASAMADEAARHTINHGRAEEVYLMQPDLVVTSTLSARHSTAMLRRLGIPVITLAPANSLKDVHDRILEMGAALGQTDRARAIAAAFDEDLARLRATAAARPSAVLYYANGYTLGDQTLAGQILLAAGFSNAASAAGYKSGTRMPLEVLAMTVPDTVITSSRYPGASRAEDIMDHPVVQTLRRTTTAATIADHDWLCGTPHVLRAIEKLVHTRRALQGDGP